MKCTLDWRKQTLARALVLTAAVGLSLALAASQASAQNDWVSQNSGTTEDFYGVSFVDGSKGWAVGWDYQNLYHSMDSGKTWITQDPVDIAYFYAVSFCDVMNGMTVGSEGAILHTQDGGATWNDAQYGWWLTLRGAHMADPSLGIAVGSNTINQPMVSWTTDGWASLNHAVFYFEKGSVMYEGYLTDVHAMDASTWFTTGRIWSGEGAICMTTDGGSTWTTHEWVGQALRALDFPSSQVGYAVGDLGIMLKTTDGGQTWTALSSGVSDNLQDVAFLSENEGLAVGDAGLILSTQDGGASWTKEQSGVFVNLRSVQYPAPELACAVGDGGVILTRGGEAKTLLADATTIPASKGGAVNFDLSADAANAGRDYLLLGSVSGTSPGMLLPGGSATLPLNWDAFTNVVIDMMNTAVFSNFMGTLDASGNSAAQLNTQGPLSPRLVGVEMCFAYLLSSPYDFASNAVKVVIVN